MTSICMQRFEHPTTDKTSARKIEARVRFPASLNMAEFTTLGLKTQEKAGKSSNPANMA